MTNAQFYLEDLKTKFKKIELEKYYLSYSGGKDSHLLYWFIKKYAPEFSKIQVVGINTALEHPEIRERIYKNCDVVLIPEKKPMQIKSQYGIPCFSKEQDQFIYGYQKAIREHREPAQTYKNKINRTYKTGFSISKKASEYVLSGHAHKITHLCCYYLKKQPAHKFEKESRKKAILGVRGNESNLRKIQYKSCFTKDKKFTPLWDLTDELEKQIYEQFNIEIPNVYKYVTRTGCMGCPYGSYKHDTEKELQLIKGNQRKFICEYFKESYDVLGIDTSEQLSLF